MKKPTFNKTIGILGGMGPEASANLYYNIIKTSQCLYGSQQDSDYPAMMISNLSMRGFDESGIVDEVFVLQHLQAAVKKLEAADVDMIIIACNTVHYFYPQLQEIIDVPILNLIEETGKRVRSHRHQKVGLLSSQSTNRLGLYDKVFEQFCVEVIKPTPEEQELLNQKILAVMEGKQALQDKASIQEVIFRLKQEGAEAIVLGCTELPLIISAADTTIPVYDSCQIIIEEVLKKASQ